MSRSSREAGFTLVEVLLAMVLMLVLLAATLAVFATMERGSRDNQRQNDVQRDTRVATDSLARRLRNLASPSDAAGATAQQPIERAEAQDLVFRTVNGDTTAATAANPQNLERYRYCLSSTKQLHVQRQTWTGADPGIPGAASCPGGGWPESRVVATGVVNAARPVFSYLLSPVGSYSEQSSVAPASFSTVVGIRSELFVDADTARKPRESTLTTRVFLRNQNRQPVAGFTAVVVSGRKIQLNGTDSDDPEGVQLAYAWYLDGVKLASTSATPTFNATVGTHSVYLKVTDVGNLSAQTPARTITCLSISTTCTVS